MSADNTHSPGHIHEPRIAIGAIFKNEAPYVLEWVAYHRRIGVDRFFIADNSSDDGTSEILADLAELGIINHIPFPHVPDAPPQLPAYSEIMRRHGNDADWIAFIDADEFLVPTDGAHSIRPLISEIDQDPSAGAILVNWATYGSSGRLEVEDGLVIERFTERAQKDWHVNHHHKAILRSRAFRRPHGTPHMFVLLNGYRNVHTDGSSVTTHPTRGEGLSQDISWERLRLNHYVVKSREEFFSQKGPKGRATVVNQKKGPGYFEHHDKNDVKDPMPNWLIESTREYVEELKGALKKIDGKLRTEENKTKMANAMSTIIRGAIDNVVFDDSNLTVRGWAVLDNGSPAPFLCISIGGMIFDKVSLSRISRPDVVRRVPGADLACGYSVTLSLADIPTDLKFAEIRVVGGTSDIVSYQVTESGRRWHEGLHIKYNSPYRGKDFLDELKILGEKASVDVIFDVGANIGQSVKEFKHALPECTIYAFEPVKSTYSELLKNVSHLPNVNCFNLAVSNLDRNELFIENVPLSVDNRIVPEHSGQWVERVEAVSGIDFCTRMNIKTVDFLKIDTEGYDLEVLKGFQRMLADGRIKFIQIECGMNRGNKKHVNIYDVLEFFRGFQYDLFGIYEQVREMDGRIPLRRANIVMASSRMV